MSDMTELSTRQPSPSEPLSEPLLTLPPSEKTSGACRALQTTVLLAGAGLGALAAVNALIAWNTPPLGTALSGGFNRYPSRYGDLAYFVSGSGAPLLLLHALRPGNSCAEWENNFEFLSQHFTVYAPDFLGWGLSDKPRHILRATDYAEQISHFVEDIIGANPQGASTPVTVIASGEACACALLAAQEMPERFSKFVFVCPTTSEEYSPAPEPDEESEPALYKFLTLPIVGAALSNLLTSRSRLESDARQHLFFDKSRAGGGAVARLHAAAHQPGSGHALAARAAGVLAASWRGAWSALSQPALIVWGRNAEDFSTAPEWLALKPDADLEVFDHALVLPHVEHGDNFNTRVLRWLAR
jgi:pimeloyl-ACP methyl ester carboxylesterase